MCRTRSAMTFCLVMLLLSGCASSVKQTQSRDPAPAAAPATVTKLQDRKYRAVLVGFASDVQRQQGSSPQIDLDKLSGNVQQALRSEGLLDTNSGNRVEITVIEVRVRESAAAIMLGFMAGSDRITGEVAVKDAHNKTLNSFQVSASYALGGLAGADSARLNWLYDEFAKLTVNELNNN